MMPDQPTVTLPSEATEDDIRRVRETARIVRRNVRIRNQYPDFRDEQGKWSAYEALAERHDCSVSTVRKVLNGTR